MKEIIFFLIIISNISEFLDFNIKIGMTLMVSRELRKKHNEVQMLTEV